MNGTSQVSEVRDVNQCYLQICHKKNPENFSKLSKDSVTSVTVRCRACKRLSSVLVYALSRSDIT